MRENEPRNQLLRTRPHLFLRPAFARVSYSIYTKCSLQRITLSARKQREKFRAEKFTVDAREAIPPASFRQIRQSRRAINCVSEKLRRIRLRNSECKRHHFVRRRNETVDDVRCVHLRMRKYVSRPSGSPAYLPLNRLQIYETRLVTYRIRPAYVSSSHIPVAEHVGTCSDFSAIPFT